MKVPILAAVVVALGLSTAASADVTITFGAPPPLVVVSPGIQVVENYGDEVFFVSGWYWVRSGPVWYRTTNHRGGWVVVENRFVPSRIVGLPPGQYKHYRGKAYVMKRPAAVEKSLEKSPGNKGVVHKNKGGKGKGGGKKK